MKMEKEKSKEMRGGKKEEEKRPFGERFFAIKYFFSFHHSTNESNKKKIEKTFFGYFEMKMFFDI